jgi:hypothetical protein
MSGVAISSLPAPDAVARLLRDLFGKAVSPKRCGPAAAVAKMYVATYIDDRDALRGMCLCDVPLAATMGAALALIPPDAAAAAARAGKLPPEMLENFREVLNILHSQFGAVHVRFRDLVQPAEKLPPAFTTVVTKPSARLDLEIAVAGYAGGRLSFLLP